MDDDERHGARPSSLNRPAASPEQRPEPQASTMRMTNKRFLACLTVMLCGAAMMHAMMTRSLGLSLVCMTSNHSGSGSNDTAGGGGQHATTFDWDLLIQGQVIAMHDWGELVLLPVSGLLISLSDPALILCVASGMALISNVLFPIATVSLGFAGAMLARFLLGMSHAFTAPSVDATVSKWTPSSCRSTLYSFITCGSQLSMVIGNPLIAVLCGAGLFGGWPAIFYIVSLLALGWLSTFNVFYLFQLRADRNSSAERRPVLYSRHSDTEAGRRLKWSLLFQSVFHELIRKPAFWALLPCSMSATFTARLFTFYIPSYYHDVLALSLMDNAFFSSLPFVMLMVGKIFFSTVSDLIVVRRRLLDRNRSSKLFNSIAFLGSGTCVLILGLTSTMPRQAVIAILTLGLTFHSATTPGYLTSVVSMNKAWTGAISAVCTLIAMVSGILLPLLVSSVVVTRVASEWRTVFCCIAGFDVLAATIYALFGKVEGVDDRSVDEGLTIKA